MTVLCRHVRCNLVTTASAVRLQSRLLSLVDLASWQDDQVKSKAESFLLSLLFITLLLLLSVRNNNILLHTSSKPSPTCSPASLFPVLKTLSSSPPSSVLTLSPNLSTVRPSSFVSLTIRHYLHHHLDGFSFPFSSPRRFVIPFPAEPRALSPWLAHLEAQPPHSLVSATIPAPHIAFPFRPQCGKRSSFL